MLHKLLHKNKPSLSWGFHRPRRHINIIFKQTKWLKTAFVLCNIEDNEFWRARLDIVKECFNLHNSLFHRNSKHSFGCAQALPDVIHIPKCFSLEKLWSRVEGGSSDLFPPTQQRRLGSQQSILSKIQNQTVPSLLTFRRSHLYSHLISPTPLASSLHPSSSLLASYLKQVSST